jgi:hypothetical protein
MNIETLREISINREIAMYFDDEFLKSLPDDWTYAVEKIAEKFKDVFPKYDLSDDKYYYIVQEAQLLLTVFCQKKLPKRRYNVPNLTGTRKANVQNVSKFIEKLFTDSQKHIKQQVDAKKQDHYKNVFEIAFGDVFHFEFTEGDLERIQQLINELRDLISKTKKLKQKHKQRLLSKLEKLQSEFHKKVTDLDRVWGFLIEASIVLGQAGENIKPMVDRIRELVSIVWPTQTRAYDLASGLPFKLLGQSEDDKSKDKKS